MASRLRTLRTEDGFTLVELLVVMVILGIVAGGTTSAIIATMRSNSYGEELRRVMDDGRASIDRIRRELRGGRSVLAGSDAFELNWWVDQNQDGVKDNDEVIHFCVAPLTSTNGNDCFTSDPGPGRYQLIRWTDASGPTNASSIARTLTSASIFSGYAGTVTQTSSVTITFLLDVDDTGRGPDDLEMNATVRLRNVPFTL